MLYRKIMSVFAIVAVLFFLVGPQLIQAASLSALSDTQSRLKASTLSVHKILFTSTSAIAAGNTIAVAFPSGFTTTGLVITDLQICHGATGVEHGTAVVTGGTACSATDETIAASNGASTVWGAVISGTTTITFTAPSGTFTNTITAGQKVTIYVTAAHMQNPAVSTPTTTITTTSDSGSFTVAIVDDDQVTVSATVNETMTFDLDTYATSTLNTETATPYTVALGTLSTGSVTGSNESSINGIWFDLGTNAGGGAIVSVQSSNGALKSTAVPGDTIPSATAAMAAGTANYGVCADRNAATTGTLTKVAPFASTCGTTPSSNSVGAVTTSAQTIYNTAGAPINAGRGEIMVDAA
ncbi:MAG TPA: hypothetical protein VGO21_04720, partial [Candidatus Paceibacterota bacterium]|nr:hypothetical protein [Candidatus Paceibacterota bacterium]